jgi:hypothetical protein
MLRSPRSPRSPSPVRTRASLSATARAFVPVATARAASPAARAPVARARASSPAVRASAPTIRAASSPKKDRTDPYATPFWPPSNYSVPARVISNSPTPLPRTLAKHKAFIVELKKILINEKVIDRDSRLFKGLLEEQQKYNMMFHSLKPYNIVCFVKCDYQLYDKMAPRVFHKGNKEPYFGNYDFVNLLKKNNMSMKWWGNNILYIHKNRF